MACEHGSGFLNSRQSPFCKGGSRKPGDLHHAVMLPVSKKTGLYIVDVFAERKYAGNQLAVVFPADGLPAPRMLAIAREMHYSETAFIYGKSLRKNCFRVRIFTPERELPFAGHPVLGAAFVIQREIIGKKITGLSLCLPAGKIPVSFTCAGGRSDMLWMKQNSPVFGKTLKARRVCEVLGIGAAEIDSRFPAQEVSTGLPFIIVPVKKLKTMKKIRVSRERFLSLVKKREAKDILVFCPETCDKRNDLHVRVFTEYEGIPEDPATGSANGCLAAYLAKHGYFGADKTILRSEQGIEMGRPSLLFLKTAAENGKIQVHVGGRVFMTARGCLC